MHLIYLCNTNVFNAGITAFSFLLATLLPVAQPACAVFQSIPSIFFNHQSMQHLVAHIIIQQQNL
jgi:hypothetical protein